MNNLNRVVCRIVQLSVHYLSTIDEGVGYDKQKCRISRKSFKKTVLLRINT